MMLLPGHGSDFDMVVILTESKEKQQTVMVVMLTGKTTNCGSNFGSLQGKTTHNRGSDFDSLQGKTTQSW